ncbi:MAG: all3515 family Zur-repressed PEP-CTERM protein [Gammaproteobacteria bacterium]|nr:all3515 family Zur-repressed PEP-CTERM protein [Gammaproteobacteria bacterium]
MATAAQAAPVGGAGYLIGRDRLETLATGAYAGQANPNFGRLTLLYNHGDHFHPIGAYSLTGPAASPTVQQTNTNNRLPEVSSLQPPLPLTVGAGLYAGKQVSSGNDALEYGDLRMVAFDVLLDDAPGSPEAILANSSNGRYKAPIAGARVGLQLVSISAGLNVGDGDTLNLLSVGQTIEISDGGTLDFEPVFWVDAGAAAGTYSAALRLVELGTSGAVLSRGGVFNFDFAAPAPIPLPAAVWLLGGGMLPLVLRARRPA